MSSSASSSPVSGSPAARPAGEQPPGSVPEATSEVTSEGERPRLVLTGAAGRVGHMLLPGLVDAYDVVLTDRVPIENLPDGVPDDLPRIVGDLADRDFVARVTDGAEAVVHLAANAGASASWDELRAPNIDVLANVLHSDVRRIVLASSVHAMGGYVARGAVPVRPDWAPAPCCTYGATKAFAEALARVRADADGKHVVALRLGATQRIPDAVTELPLWLGADDLRQLVSRALQTDLPFVAVHGISANTRRMWDTDNPIGYLPTQDSEPYADRIPRGDRSARCPV